MAVREEDSSADLGGIQSCSWIPLTPAKPHLMEQQLICDNCRENYFVQENRARAKAERFTQDSFANQPSYNESERLPACCAKGNPITASAGYHSWEACEASSTSPVPGDNFLSSNFQRVNRPHIHEKNTSFIDSCLRGNATGSEVKGQRFCISSGFSRKQSDKWEMSFGDLLAQAHESGTAEAANVVEQTDFMATSSSSPSNFRPGIQDSQIKKSTQKSSMEDANRFFAPKSEAELNSMPDILKAAGNSTHFGISFDLNFSPARIKDTSPRDIMLSQLEPMTPEKTNRTELMQKSVASNLNVDAVSVKQNTQGDNVVRNDFKGIYKKGEDAKLVIDQLSATISPQLQENYKPDKGGNEKTELIKTPQQKSRRKKHRPKVMVVDQCKSSPRASARNRTATQKTIKVKRKFKTKGADHSIYTPLEGKSSGIDSSNFVPKSIGKRESEKRAGKSDLKLKSVTKTRSLKSMVHIRSSCRRSLNFNLENQVTFKRSLCHSSSNGDLELQAVILSAKEISREYMPAIKKMTVFSSAKHDEEASTEEETDSPSDHLMLKNPSDAYHNYTCLTRGRQVGGLKRRHMNIDSGSGGIHFPEIYKKRRTERRSNRVPPNLKCMTASDNLVNVEKQLSENSCKKLFTERPILEFPVSQRNNPAGYKSENEQKIFRGPLALAPTDWIKKRRSKGPTRTRNLASLIEICKGLSDSSRKRAQASTRIGHNIKRLHKRSSCMEALVADIYSTITTKKRSNRSMLINATVRKLYDHHNYFCKSIGPLMGITWKRMSPTDSVIEKFCQLDLNAISNHVSTGKQNVSFKYQNSYEENNAIIPYESTGAVVPFDSLFDPVRRRQSRPKVDLDVETNRVWKLLLENINSEGIDGTDDGNRKWWEDERRVFNGRADTFIARMRLIQGDRRFSPWKGSVVDSVVGVFLTQNVSDHLSSSAFMSLAAYFPFKSKVNVAGLYEERVSTGIKEPEEKFGGITPKVNEDLVSENSKHSLSMSDNFQAINTMRLKVDQRDTEDRLSAQTLETSSESITSSSILLNGKTTETRLLSASEEEPAAASKQRKFSSSTSFVKLLQRAETILHCVSEKGIDSKMAYPIVQVQSRRSVHNLQNGDHFSFPEKPYTSYSTSTVCMEEDRASECVDIFQDDILVDTTSRKIISAAEVQGFSVELDVQSTLQMFTTDASKEKPRSHSPDDWSSSNCQIDGNQITVEAVCQLPEYSPLQENKNEIQDSSSNRIYPQNSMKVTGIRKSDRSKISENMNDPDYDPGKPTKRPAEKEGRMRKEKLHPVDWDHLKNEARTRGKMREKMANTMDTVDWEAVRCADANEIAQIIKERGMNNMLAERIKEFLNRIARDHGSTDLEWLRDIPPDKAKEYLLSIKGLGLKSVECVRLLTLHQIAFPVDTNVGRIAVRLGWVPLQPLPESLQLHLLELYPVLESIQKYLWPRLCKLDQRTLYELHYQMITFGKVFCTKNKPNCNACPMRGECRHFASAFASARLSLPEPGRNIMSITENKAAGQNSVRSTTLWLPSPAADQIDTKPISNFKPIIEEPTTPEPSIEVAETPEAGRMQVPEYDIENSFCEGSDEIPTIRLNMEELTQNLQEIMHRNTKLMEKDMSKALVALNSDAASIPVPKLKNVSRLRTEHQVYELPDSHPLLEGMDKRDPDDPCPYLLAIWTPGETSNSTEPPERRCRSQDTKRLCPDETCLSCNSIRETDSQTVRGTLLIPCRTAMRGSFPLNGTYFQVNEVFSDHETSLNPMDVPREWLWNMRRRIVYFGTSIPTIFKGLSMEAIQLCFWRGFICIRGFDRRTRAPRPLIARLHFPVSRVGRGRGKTGED